MRQATKTEIRNHFTSAGYEVRISRAGHVEFRTVGTSTWLEGRWVEEYKTDEDGKVHHS